MGAMRNVDSSVVFPLHSSNYFARWEMETLDVVGDVELLPGMVVFKSRIDNGQIHDRYKEGGDYYKPARTLDYYHAGVVVSINPLEIWHCTSGNGINGIAFDDKIGNWSHAGWANEVHPENTTDADETETAIVSTPDGNPLKLRPKPSANDPYIAKIPNGDTVSVFSEAEGWAKVYWQGMSGFCMSKFLVFDRAQEAENPPEWLREITSRLDIIIALLGGEAVG